MPSRFFEQQQKCGKNLMKSIKLFRRPIRKPDRFG
jgi:hypothetical protein